MGTLCENELFCIYKLIVSKMFRHTDLINFCLQNAFYKTKVALRLGNSELYIYFFLKILKTIAGSIYEIWLISLEENILIYES